MRDPSVKVQESEITYPPVPVYSAIGETHFQTGINLTLGFLPQAPLDQLILYNTKAQQSPIRISAPKITTLQSFSFVERATAPARGAFKWIATRIRWAIEVIEKAFEPSQPAIDENQGSQQASQPPRPIQETTIGYSCALAHSYQNR
jgi:hypothetical protein